MSPTVGVKRVYEPSAESDGFRVLVDRLWPRGLTKEKARVDLWLREIAPGDALRQWFNHEPEKWEEFKKRYAKELESRPELLEQLRQYLEKGKVTLLFGSKEERYNNARALQEYLEKKS
jgi:uncharacterized protein YeaO (DUF488 family)